MRLRTYIGYLVCAVLVVSAGALRLAPTVEAQPLVRNTSATSVLTSGTNTLSTVAEALVGSSLVAWECLVQNDPDNTVDILVGSAAVQAIQLAPGQSITIPVQDCNTIFLKSVSATPTANYLAR